MPSGASRKLTRVPASSGIRVTARAGVGAAVVHEAVRLVQLVRFRALVPRLEHQAVAAVPARLVGAGIEQRPRVAAPPRLRRDEEVGDPRLDGRPVQPLPQPEADDADNAAAVLGDEDAGIAVGEMLLEHGVLVGAVLRSRWPPESLQQLEHGVGVADVRRANAHGIDRYSRRNAGRKPRRGQKREARRLVTRQSVTTAG